MVCSTGARTMRTWLGLLLVVACGGQAASDAPPPMSSGGSGPTALCEQTEPVPASCVPQLIPLEFTAGSKQQLPNGVVIEALQIPVFDASNQGPLFDYSTAPPELWDRSALPAGACVFRLHGVDARCYSDLDRSIIQTGGCDRPLEVAPGGYDVRQCRDIAPGCPKATWFTTPGYWWYLNEADGAVDVVICAPECAGSFAGGSHCLRLNPPP